MRLGLGLHILMLLRWRLEHPQQYLIPFFGRFAHDSHPLVDKAGFL